MSDSRHSFHMEEHDVKPLKSTAARGVLAVFAAGSALAITACSAGQISQTANQVPAVDGVYANPPGTPVRDITVSLQEDGSTALKFTTMNKTLDDSDVTLRGITVAGRKVELDGDTSLGAGCSIVADGAAGIRRAEPEGGAPGCIHYVTTSVPGDSYLAGGHEEVVFDFSTGEVKVNAPVAAYVPEAGQVHRGADGRYTTGH
ncbi:hypothetical protein [Corynebacterium bovis]|uniref:hypothetical protein n=2 Tax=Corynebacterium bovis TaxID=36808 RepID=UPI00163981E5|nr:hypothetical protein [Corynebacterium bovis]MDN8578629.1 hypothetical protein [Corynebacterium bovis]